MNVGMLGRRPLAAALVLGFVAAILPGVAGASARPTCTPVGVSKWVNDHLTNLKHSAPANAYPGEREIYAQVHRCLGRSPLGAQPYIRLTETIVLQRLQQDSGASGDVKGQVRWSNYYTGNLFWLIRDPSTPIAVQTGVRALLLAPYVPAKK
ncbi:MAG: hypothetical protein ABI346_10575 [Candidatus Baltobacteraceae bacterium]